MVLTPKKREVFYNQNLVWGTKCRTKFGVGLFGTCF